MDRVDIESKAVVLKKLLELEASNLIKPCKNLRIKHYGYSGHIAECIENAATRQKAPDINRISKYSLYTWPECPKDCPYFKKVENFSSHLAETSSSQRQSIVPQKVKRTEPTYPDKITLSWLAKYVPIKFWLYLLGLLSLTYLLGSELGPNDPISRLIIWIKDTIPW